jgi:transposase
VGLRMSKKRRVRRLWADEEKIRIIAQTRVPGVSVSQVARRYDVNANLIFKWLRDPRFNPPPVEDRTASFLPVEVVGEPPVFDSPVIDAPVVDGPMSGTNGPGPEGRIPLHGINSRPTERAFDRVNIWLTTRVSCMPMAIRGSMASTARAT